ncbi:PLP-dependent aminotransferase family protein [Cohnella faecalis]|uniref:PLP-dependent aminotransferase family protein n=1 Tax=Cohnella faecalis TaxID=2315694 RepID=A0A398CIS6_9BACL|nr:PLP-dependent aminotransferase family protein [Cohnella faecalis]RIE02280.1 PLP-dependent aminotransferase family protein [Cohnella faecalis]
MTHTPANTQPYPFAKRVPAIPPIGAAQASSRSDTIPLSFGAPHSDTFPYDALNDAASEAILSQGRDALQYAGASGPSFLLDWIAARSARRAINVEPSQVLLTYGSQQAIDFAARTLLDPGDHAWVEAPTYFGAVSTFRTAEAVLTSFPIDADGLQTDEVEAALRAAVKTGKPIPKLLYVMPNFHNPGGVSLSLERRKKLAELAVEFNFFILEDDAYTELAFEEQALPSIYSFAPERVVYLSTFSKTIAPGIRLGWAIGSRDVISRMNTFFQGSKASVFSQEIVAQLLKKLPFEEHIAKLNGLYRANRDAMVSALKQYFGDDVRFEVPGGGFFVWLEFREDVDTSQFVQDAYERGVSFIHGKQFFVKPEGARFARLSFSYCDEERIHNGVKLLADAYYAYVDNK